jgi:hypothetical protein
MPEAFCFACPAACSTQSKKIFSCGNNLSTVLFARRLPQFRCIQKNFCHRDLANDLSRVAISNSIAICRTALHRRGTQAELKSNRHTSVIDAA